MKYLILLGVVAFMTLLLWRNDRRYPNHFNRHKSLGCAFLWIVAIVVVALLLLVATGAIPLENLAP